MVRSCSGSPPTRAISCCQFMKRGPQKGTPNRTTAELRQQITAARPVEFLIKVAEGRRVRIGPQAGPGEAAYAYPSLEQRLRAAELLMKKILPI